MLTDPSRQYDFPSLAHQTYLNTAAEGIPPSAVTTALGQYAQDKLLGMDGRPLHEAQRRGAIEQTAQAFGLSPDEIGICSCSSEAYNLAAMALRLQPGDEVVINDLDFPAGATPWLQADCPATTRLWCHRDGALRVEDLVKLLGPRTRLVTVSLVSFYNGHRVNLPAIIEAVRQHSPAMIALDVTQALGRIPLDLTGVDLVISSTHKWILASHGGGLVGVPKAKADQWTVPAGGWFNLENAFDTDRFDRTVTRRGAASFCVGMPNYAAIYAIHAALRYINAVGISAIDDYAQPLVRMCMDELKRLPVQLITPDEPGALAGIIALKHEKAQQIHDRLHEQNIHIMSQAGRLRIAIHGYNTSDDIEHFLKTIREALNDC